VCRADDADLPGVAQTLQRRQMVAPGDEVVDLVEVNTPAEVAQRALRLRLALSGGGRPDLAGDERLVASALHRQPQNTLGLPIHRRGIEEVRACLQSRVDNGARVGFLCRASHVESAPGAHAHNWYTQAALA